MICTPIGRAAASVALCLLAAPALAQREKVPELQDLLGTNSGSLQTAMARRGYTYLGRGAGVRANYEYWRSKANDCVGVQVDDNRVNAALFAPSAQCDKAATNRPATPEPSLPGFATVCGVVQGGKANRFRCTVEGVAPGTVGGTTILHLPENTVTLAWRAANRASVTFAGRNTQDVAVTTAAGRTTFMYDAKPYFWISDGAVAAAELKTLP